MIKASDILKVVSAVLQDLEEGQQKRWTWERTESEGVISLLDIMDFSTKSIALMRPDSTAITKNVLLKEGSIQNIPHDALMLLNIVRNMGCDGYTPGKPVQITTLEMVTRMSPYEKSRGYITHYAYDRLSDPKRFWIFPTISQQDDVWVEMIYSLRPKPVECADSCINMNCSYQEAIAHHMLAAIFSGDNDVSNLQRSQYHATMYSNLMGTKSQVDSTWPKTRGTL